MNPPSQIKPPLQSTLGGAFLAISLLAAPLVSAQSGAQSGAQPSSAQLSGAQSSGATSGFELGISTLGIYISPKFAISNKVAVRVPFFTGSGIDSFTHDGNTIIATLDTSAFAVIADYHPWKNGFRLSAGAGFGGYEATGNITNPTLGGTLYAGSFDFAVSQKNHIVPIISVGYARPLGHRVRILAEVGAKIGSYELVTTGNTLDPLLQAGFDAEVVSVNNDISEVNALPFATLGIQFNF